MSEEMEFKWDQNEFNDDCDLESLEFVDDENKSRKRTTSAAGSEERMTSCMESISGPEPPVTLKAESVTSAGRNYEVDFRSLDQEEPAMESTSDRDFEDDSEKRSKRELKELYDAGLWAPHPEHYLPPNCSLGESASVFSKLKSTMNLITRPDDHDNYTYKKVTHEGSGIPVERGQIVVVHYVAFVEYADEPVDLAFSRSTKRSFKLQLDKGSALPGFETAVKSMCVEEKSIFIVSPSLAYGTRGCPPRYPGNAEVFYFIDLVAVRIDDQLEQVMNLSIEEREHLKFRKVRNAVARCAERVAAMYRSFDYRRALAQQRWVIDLLERCHVLDEEEDIIRNRLLISSLRNAVMISYQAKLPKSVLYYTGNLLHLDETQKRALYYRIEAHIELKSWSDALVVCRKALKHYPESITFNRCLEKGVKELAKEKYKEREMYQKMLGMTKPVTPPKLVPGNVAQEAAAVPVVPGNAPDDTRPLDKILESMKEFQKKRFSPKKELDVGGLSMKDLQAVERAATEALFRVSYFSDESGNEKILLSK